MEQTEKTIAIVDKCLSYLVKAGLYKATSRELSLESGLNKTGLYYYFKSKDDVVLTCAERAIQVISDAVMLPAIKEVLELTFDVERFAQETQNFVPFMNFLIQVYSESTYRAKMDPLFFNANELYQSYAEKIARVRQYDLQAINPYIHVCITTITNYMIFHDETYLAPQFELISSGIKEVTARQSV